MKKCRDIHDIIQTEIEYTAYDMGLKITYTDVKAWPREMTNFKYHDCLGFSVTECSKERTFIAAYLFRMAVEGGVEFATYSRNNIEYLCEEPCWNLYDRKRFDATAHFFGAVQEMWAEPCCLIRIF